jgi:hypothetical protein
LQDLGLGLGEAHYFGRFIRDCIGGVQQNCITVKIQPFGIKVRLRAGSTHQKRANPIC